MKNILLFGAGKSSGALINYLLEQGKTNNWTLLVADVSVEAAEQKIKGYSNAEALKIDINNISDRLELIAKADLVISLLPANLHYLVAESCLQKGKSLFTASYISPEIKLLDAEVKKKGLLFLNEIGLDPGIDHMSAMKLMDEIREKGGRIEVFKSYCGGLVAPESDTNPWGYKFSWNPRNVILAGQATAKYILDGSYKYIPYTRVFSDIQEINVEGYGSFEAYANRDSLSYRQPYGLDAIPTLLRGTLRKKNFCGAWNLFVQLGLTDDTYTIEKSEELSYKELIDALLPSHIKGSETLEKLCTFSGLGKDATAIQLFIWAGLLENRKIAIKDASPAKALQALLEEKWKLEEHDKDMVVMQHQLEYTLNDDTKKVIADLVVIGDDANHTAMAKTVGLPLGIAAKLYLQGKLNITGVQMPLDKGLYTNVLSELEDHGVTFTEFWD